MLFFGIILTLTKIFYKNCQSISRQGKLKQRLRELFRQVSFIHVKFYFKEPFNLRNNYGKKSNSSFKKRLLNYQKFFNLLKKRFILVLRLLLFLSSSIYFKSIDWVLRKGGLRQPLLRTFKKWQINPYFWLFKSNNFLSIDSSLKK